jgi:hypothetical protein
MSDDDSAQRPFDENLDRESGVFVEPDAHGADCDPQADACAPDDYINDPDARETGIPGTVDDIPMRFGVEVPAAADHHIVADGATKAGAAAVDPVEAAEDETSPEEKELWAAQIALLEEDESGGLNLRGFPEEEIPEILGAMGDDAADPLQDFPNGTSATGDWAAPEHGGFPERNE